jgi:hypothetical protein
MYVNAPGSGRLFYHRLMPSPISHRDTPRDVRWPVSTELKDGRLLVSGQTLFRLTRQHLCHPGQVPTDAVTTTAIDQ